MSGAYKYRPQYTQNQIGPGYTPPDDPARQEYIPRLGSRDSCQRRQNLSDLRERLAAAMYENAAKVCEGSGTKWADLKHGPTRKLFLGEADNLL
jgi:hypothetical protein